MSATISPPATPSVAAFRLQKSQQRVLKIVAQLHYVTIDQLCDALILSRASRSWLRKTVRSLWLEGYLLRQVLPREALAGSSPYAYRLAKKGFAVVKAYQEELGLLLPRKYRLPDGPASQAWLEHDLAVNRILIAALRLDHDSPEFDLAHLYHDRSLKRWIRVQLANGRTVALDPDGYIEFIYRGRWQVSLLLECDRGHHNQRSWREKIQKHVAYIQSGAHRELFAAPRLQIPVFVDSAKPLRVEQLRQWTEVELEGLGAEGYADYFSFARFQPESTTPEELFGARLWSRPFQAEPLPLVAVPERPTAPELAGPQVVQAD